MKIVPKIFKVMGKRKKNNFKNARIVYSIFCIFLCYFISKKDIKRERNVRFCPLYLHKNFNRIITLYQNFESFKMSQEQL